MIALVTGATGFIGSNLVKKLLAKGWRVRVLSRKIGTNQKIDWVKGDIADQEIIAKATRRVDIIFNLAGTLPHHHAPDKIYLDTNVKGVENILKACLKEKVKRLIHVSTVGIYGQTGEGMVDERSKWHLDSIYAKTKAKGEKIVMDYCQKYRIPTVIIRPTIGYGPHDVRPGFLTLFRLLKKGLLVPLGDGRNFFHTIYVENLVDALILASYKREAVGEDFIIGDDPCPMMKDIWQEMEKITGVKLLSFFLPMILIKGLARFGDILLSIGLPAPIYSQRINFLTENRRYSIEKAKKILGYKPKVNLSEGLKKTYQWYQQEGLIR